MITFNGIWCNGKHAILIRSRFEFNSRYAYAITKHERYQMDALGITLAILIGLSVLLGIAVFVAAGIFIYKTYKKTKSGYKDFNRHDRY